jgi:outer membrane protein assembly factor BamB
MNLKRTFIFSLSLTIFVLLMYCEPQPGGYDPDAPQWPCFRGPNHNGISEETEWSHKRLTGEPEIAWEVLLGNGYSSLTIQGNHLYTVAHQGGNDTVYCLDINDGRIVWEYSYTCESGQYAGPRSTPTADGKSIYIMSREGRVFCLDAASGEVVWRKYVNMIETSVPYYGFASSPYIKEDYVIVNCRLHGAVYNKTSGEPVWESPAGVCGYASPVLYQSQGQDNVLFFGASALYAVELESGRLLWEYEWPTEGGLNIADPLVIENNKVFISSNYGTGCALLDISGDEPKLLWSNNNMENHFSTSIYKDGYIYGINGDAVTHSGSLACMDITDGRVQWEEHLGYGSLILVDDKFIILTERGIMYVVKADPAQFQLLAKGNLPRNNYFTAPVFCRGRLYVKNNAGELFCVDLSQEGA